MVNQKEFWKAFCFFKEWALWLEEGEKSKTNNSKEETYSVIFNNNLFILIGG